MASLFAGVKSIKTTGGNLQQANHLGIDVGMNSSERIQFVVTQIKNPNDSKELPLTLNSDTPQLVQYFQQQFKQGMPAEAVETKVMETKLTYEITNGIQWKPTNAVRTGGCYLELKVYLDGEEKLLYRIGPGCIIAAEKPKRVIGNKIFSYPIVVLTIAADLNQCFEHFLPELITRDLQGNNSNRAHSIFDLTKIPLCCAHVGQTRSCVNSYKQFLDKESSEILYIGLEDDSEVFTFEYRNDEPNYSKVHITSLGKGKKRIISEIVAGTVTQDPEIPTDASKDELEYLLPFNDDRWK
jgi:hypothetical protein